MLILGWHGGILRSDQDAAPGWSTHDGAAVLLRDGVVVSAVEEERLNRIKHSNCFPAHAIRRCLEIGGVDLRSVDLIALNFEERTRQVFPADAGLPSVNAFLEDPGQQAYSVREVICDIFDREFGVDVSARLFFCNHHRAHLWSAFRHSGFHESLVVSLDGSGDNLSGMIGVGDMNGIETIREYPVELSLGNLYSDMIRFLGYNRFDEYKVMGLAPYGDAERFKDLFTSMYRLLPAGEFELASRVDRWSAMVDSGLLRLARRRGESFTRLHKDFAAGLQGALETIVLHVLSHHRERSHQANLCLAGGVGHNCTLNGRLLREGGFASIFVQPAAHDAGGALGAAMAAHESTQGDPIRAPLAHIFFGAEVGDDLKVEETLQGWGALLDISRHPDVPRKAARLLADGLVIGWVQGRAEFGPRALGHRSILADPRPPENSRRINRMIKRREAYRPFAPSILAEEVEGLIELPGSRANLSFMTFTLQVKPSARARLAAVTHVDGSARVQTVSREIDPLYWRLISEFQTLTGVPAVLNTSFNNDVEPIVDSVNDAVTCFLTTDLDVLVVGNFIVRKQRIDERYDLVLPLDVTVPDHWKLVRRTRQKAGTRAVLYALESTASRHFTRTHIPISQTMFAALALVNEACRVDQVLGKAAFPSEAEWTDAMGELMGLWSQRAVLLQSRTHCDHIKRERDLTQATCGAST
ncbi:MAG TPA: carbamoyltransferase C-terminal domain-containing protein [Longimicrobium sp.]|jgi:carbamoyltransferase